MDLSHRSDVDQDGGNHPPGITQKPGLDTTSDGQYIAASEPPAQKRRSDEPDQRIKKQHPERRSDRKAGRNERDGEVGGSGKADGPRYPQRSGPPAKKFSCPFHKYDPVRYTDCIGAQLFRISDVMQHIKKSHMLQDIIFKSDGTISPEKTCVYCKSCRHEFHGLGAGGRLYNHKKTCQAGNQPATIEQAGVLLPQEVRELMLALQTRNDEVAKWNFIWANCFPLTATPPPYAENVVSRPRAHLILLDLLVSYHTNDWSSAKNRQSWIDKALSEIYSGSPFDDTEPQVNDENTLRSTIRFNPSPHEESTSEPPGVISPSVRVPIDDYFDIGSLRGTSTPNNFSNDSRYGKNALTVPDSIFNIVPKSSVDRHNIDQRSNPLKTAIVNIDHPNVHILLKNSFDKVAIGEYAWLLELKALGISMDEIADELLERAQYGPWIYSKFNVRDVETYHQDFHIAGCLHSDKEDESMPTVPSHPTQARTSTEAGSENSFREAIQYLCGIGGVSPVPDGSPSLQFGSVVFEDSHSTAIISLVNGHSAQVVTGVLQHLHKAIGTLQQVGGCCDSFTFLARQESVVDLIRMIPESTSRLEHLKSLANPNASLVGMNPQLLDSLTAQFLSLAFALYAQGHCEPFEPFFLDTPLKRMLLIGNQTWEPLFTGPCILASAVELSCFGEMVQRRVFAFQYFEAFDRSKVFSDSDKKFDLKAFPEDLLDTWGPGDFIIHKDDPEYLHAISIGGGLITSNSTAPESHHLPVLHWSPASEGNINFPSTFPRHLKMVIGSRVSINQACRVTPEEHVQMAIPWLKELGTFPSYWEVSERQLGLGFQGGQSAVGIVNFAQTWVKRLGQTKKSNILAKRSLSIADLEGPFAVQVSFCTGIARRVRLRELLADVLPAYVADLATQPCYWERLQGWNILDILKHDDFRTHYQRLDRELQAEFETLAIAVLFLLQDTGVDRKGENFVVGCIPQGLALQCFKIPIEKESFWARILADSEDVATFAYVATRCFETDRVRCRGPTEPWVNTTALFSTAVSLCQDRLVTQGIQVQQTTWSLKDSEAYLIGRSDSPLLVRVFRPSILEEPRLLVSMSRIIAPFLRRWSRKQGYKKPWRLRESRAIDHQHQMAESVVVTSDFETS
ncbi:hypothetical protein FGADI_11157 [Fusarium gaditjirri]|uniref:Uncharacterized protein n=1 Tax=Fusarium gaditjirri TaxID=282569 RepID=A0A8H4WQW3_9HYPO|nr:hypothetical protein FGADI_11157 [Fusarium gaditjirri]